MVEINNLTIKEQVGQMIMVGMDMQNPKKYLQELIQKYKVGGVLLYRKNYKTYEEMISLVNYIKSLNRENKVPIFIAIDQEGGRVNRMPSEFKNIPSAYHLACCEKEDLVSVAGKITAKMLSASGINFNFAPVLDIKRFSNGHAIGDRAYSENIETVAKDGINFMKELQKQNIVSTIKHFPGHGATKKDSHFALPKVKAVKELEENDIKPFECAIKSGADCMMVSHMKVKSLSNTLPTSLNKKFITKYIRKKCKYNGVLVTDDVRMGAIRMKYGKDKAVKMAFSAGNDIVLLKHSNDLKVIDKIIEDVEKNKIKLSRVIKSTNRILKLKEKYNINDNIVVYKEELIEEINNEITTQLYN